MWFNSNAQYESAWKKRRATVKELNTQAVTFDTKVAQAVAENPQMAAYVRQLEAREQQEEGFEVEPTPKGNGGGNGHANGKDMEAELQRFLQQRKNKKDDE